MSLPLDKNRRWIAALQQSLDRLGEDSKAAIMTMAGRECASDLLSLCEKQLDKSITTIGELIDGWNEVRAERGLKGRWVFEGDLLTATFHECGCPLVRSGMIDLHPVQCYCSQAMLETIFARITGEPVLVEIRRSVGRGDEVCEFVVGL